MVFLIIGPKSPRLLRHGDFGGLASQVAFAIHSFEWLIP